MIEHADFTGPLRRMPREDLRVLALQVEEMQATRGWEALQRELNGAQARILEALVAPRDPVTAEAAARAGGEVSGLRVAARWVRAVIEVSADEQEKAKAAVERAVAVGG